LLLILIIVRRGKKKKGRLGQRPSEEEEGRELAALFPSAALGEVDERNYTGIRRKN